MKKQVSVEPLKIAFDIFGSGYVFYKLNSLCVTIGGELCTFLTKHPFNLIITVIKCIDYMSSSSAGFPAAYVAIFHNNHFFAPLYERVSHRQPRDATPHYYDISNHGL